MGPAKDKEMIPLQMGCLVRPYLDHLLDRRGCCW